MELSDCKIPWSDDLQPIVESKGSEADKVIEAWAPSSKLLSFYTKSFYVEFPVAAFYWRVSSSLGCAFLQKKINTGDLSGWPQAWEGWAGWRHQV